MQDREELQDTEELHLGHFAWLLYAGQHYHAAEKFAYSSTLQSIFDCERWALLSEIYRKLGNLPEASRTAQVAIRTDAKNYLGYRAKAIAEYENKDVERVLGILLVVHDMDPENKEMNLIFEKVKANQPIDFPLLFFGRTDADAASLISEIETAFAVDKSPENTFAMAVACHSKNDNENAEKYYRSAIEMEPTMGAYHVGLISLLRQGTDIQALSAALAIARSPEIEDFDEPV